MNAESRAMLNAALESPLTGPKTKAAAARALGVETAVMPVPARPRVEFIVSAQADPEVAVSRAERELLEKRGRR